MLHKTSIFPGPLSPSSPAGHWIEIVYDASLVEDAVRPSLVITSVSGTAERLPVPAPVLGRAIWIGLIPHEAISVYLEGPVRLRLARFARRGLFWRLTRALVRRPRHAIYAVALACLGHPARARKRLARALVARPLSGYAIWAARRYRPYEPQGIDARTGAPGNDIEVSLAPGESLTPGALDAVAAVFAADLSVTTVRGDSVIITAHGPVAGFASAWTPAQGAPFRRKNGGEGSTRHLRQVLTRHAPRRYAALPQQPDPATWPDVTIIVPTRDRLDLLRICVDGVLHGTDYPSLTLLVADNDSAEDSTHSFLAELPSRDARASVLACPGSFNFSAICNRAAAHGHGEIIVFLNNDIAVTDRSWLKSLVRLALSPNNGAVGATLLYPDKRIQHAGVAIGPGGAAGHILRGKPLSALAGIFGPRRVSAVTGACLAIRRDRFEAVRGFDEDFPVSYNDIDLCLRLEARGWKSIWSSQTFLTHRESASRRAREPDLEAVALFRERWAERIADDPHFHPAFSDAALDLELG